MSAATGAGLEGAGLEGAGLEGAGLRGAGPGALHTLIRKPIFLLLAWRVGFAAVVQSTTVRGGPALVARWLTASSVLCAAVLAGSSVARILAGQTLWWASIDGFTNNHKTLAVYLAPTIPLVWTVSPVAVALIVLAIGMSWSKAAWVTAAFALGWVTLRLRLRGPVLALGTAAALLGMALLPALARSPEQIDSLRSRMSLNRRALQMFAERPWTGWGAGTNVRYEISTYPDYRVNGVDAHGVFAKLGSEFGALGVVAWLSATGALLWRFRGRRSRLDDVLLGTFLALHLSLLTSTETFSQTHWAILGLICGLAARRR
ncbi:MAG: O-antigen ligase family protein [Myxococcales bacterium]|nr:O-antigen ligase family protein [Myxococcales bacterium]